MVLFMIHVGMAYVPVWFGFRAAQSVFVAVCKRVIRYSYLYALAPAPPTALDCAPHRREQISTRTLYVHWPYTHTHDTLHLPLSHVTRDVRVRVRTHARLVVRRAVVLPLLRSRVSQSHISPRTRSQWPPLEKERYAVHTNDTTCRTGNRR